MEEKIKEIGQKLTKKKGLKQKQKVFIEKFIEELGNITKACKKAGIKRQTFYNWKRDELFVVKFQEAIDEHDDGVQQRILKLAMEQDKEMLKFWAVNKMRHRGFGERLDIKAEFTGKVGVASSAEFAKEAFEKYGRKNREGNGGTSMGGVEC